MAAPPPYGKQQYWEERYRKALLCENQHPQQTDDEDDEKQITIQNTKEEDEPLAYHAWYFTYKDLRPILMQLILGGSSEEASLLAGEEEAEEQEEEEHSLENSDTHQEKSHVDEEEIEEEDKDENEDEDHESVERVGLAHGGPIEVLEIGCGDVPLGTGLALDLLSLQKETGKLATAIVRKIVCADYSPSLIECMKNMYQTTQMQMSPNKKQKISSTTRFSAIDKNDVVDLQTFPLEFVAMDARELSCHYDEESVDLLLEKGTLDAMLSDTESGKNNCIVTVSECARVLKRGGTLLLVSHMNAHEDKGLTWLEDIIFPGLRKYDQSAQWDIEVHGSDGTSEIQANSGVPDGSIGPAVYLIEKLLVSEPTKAAKNPGKSTIPVKFFSY